MAAKPKPEASFEEHLVALEKVVGDLEGDALSLEASIDRYKEGVAHLAACRKILDQAEQRLAELVATSNGGTQEVPLCVGPEGLEPTSEQNPAPGDAPPPPAPPAQRAAPRKSAPPPAASSGDDLPF